ncbi:MAG: segregation/condensation protein A [Candidatus Paceibacterota bacterium]
MYQVQTQQFSGPLEKLLELIEAKKLDITTISLAEVTNDFLSYIEILRNQIPSSGEEEGLSPRILSDFLIVASHLVLIKSKELLPDISFTPDEQEDIVDLERRLKMYSALKPLFLLLRTSWQTASPSFSREFMKDLPPIFYPPTTLAVSHLETALGNLLQSLGSLVVETEHIEKQLINLEEKISELSSKIAHGISHFSQVTSASPKGELIVLFLALLHLLRDQTIRVKQEGLFGEISMEKITEQ